MIGRAALALALAALCSATPAAAGFLESVPGQVVDLPTRPGVTVRYAAFVPDQAPAAIAIIFVGGGGVLNIPAEVGPTWGRTGNFLVRIRENLRRRGVYVAVLDAPSDHKFELGSFRLSQGHADDAAAVIADLRRRAPGVPVWVIGTSMGSISAANVAERLQGTRGPDGLVLTSSVSRVNPNPRASSHIGVFDVDLSEIRVPTLIAYHRGDSCEAVSQGDGPRMVGKLEKSPRKEVLLFDGGDPPASTPCEALAQHGYYGIEGQVADAIADWILAPKR
ncbi:MAG: alpha/beta hydrolase [Alphaproteobacteria bacterium]|nr:alpha/beta hydrolase [Alphaproteobacteria bacterium]